MLDLLSPVSQPCRWLRRKQNTPLLPQICLQARSQACLQGLGSPAAYKRQFQPRAQYASSRLEQDLGIQGSALKQLIATNWKKFGDLETFF